VPTPGVASCRGKYHRSRTRSSRGGCLAISWRSAATAWRMAGAARRRGASFIAADVGGREKEKRKGKGLMIVGRRVWRLPPAGCYIKPSNELVATQDGFKPNPEPLSLSASHYSSEVCYRITLRNRSWYTTLALTPSDAPWKMHSQSCCSPTRKTKNRK
jgi:hypothetical protein